MGDRRFQGRGYPMETSCHFIQQNTRKFSDSVYFVMCVCFVIPFFALFLLLLSDFLSCILNSVLCS